LPAHRPSRVRRAPATFRLPRVDLPAVSPWLAGGVALALLLAWAGLRARVTSEWTRDLQGHAGYTPPHGPMSPASGSVAVHLRTADGVAIAGTYLGQARPGALLLLPGLASTRDGLAIASLGQWLAQRFDVLILDPRGVGESGSSTDAGPAGSLDVLAACAWLQGKGHETIGVVAEHETAFAAIRAASEQRSFQALALVAPPASNRELRLSAPGGLDGRGAWSRTLLGWAGGPRLSVGPEVRLIEEVRRLPSLPTLWVGSRSRDGELIRQVYLMAPEPRSMRLYPGEGAPVAWTDYPVHLQTLSQWFELCLAEARSGSAATATDSPRIEPGAGVSGP